MGAFIPQLEIIKVVIAKKKNRRTFIGLL